MPAWIQPPLQQSDQPRPKPCNVISIEQDHFSCINKGTQMQARALKSRRSMGPGHEIERGNQFMSTYFPRVFHLTLPYLVGGPDFPRQQHPRRKFDPDSTALKLGAWLQMMAWNCLTQVRWDWDLIPGAWSVHFASQVNTSVSLGLTRTMRRCGLDKVTDADLQEALKGICLLLRDGEYKHSLGQLVKINGDISKLIQAVGLTPMQKAIVTNVQFISGTIPGTRRIRKRVGHVVN